MSEEGLLGAHSQVTSAVLQAIMKIVELRARRREEIARREEMRQREYANALRDKESADRASMQNITRAALQPGFMERSRPEDIARVYMLAQAWSEVDVQARFVADSLEPLVTAQASESVAAQARDVDAVDVDGVSDVGQGLEGDQRILATLSEEETRDYARQAELSGGETARTWLRSEFADRAVPEAAAVAAGDARPLSEAPLEDLYGRAWVATIRENPKANVGLEEVARAVQEGSASPTVAAAFEKSRQALLDSGDFVDVEQGMATVRETHLVEAPTSEVALETQWMMEVLDREGVGQSGPAVDIDTGVERMRDVLTDRAAEALYVEEWKTAVLESGQVMSLESFSVAAARTDTRSEADRFLAVEALREQIPARVDAVAEYAAPFMDAQQVAREERDTRHPELAAQPAPTLASVYQSVSGGTAPERVMAAALGPDALEQYDSERRARETAAAQERVDAAQETVRQLREEAVQNADLAREAEREHGLDSDEAVHARDRAEQSAALVERQEEDRDRLLSERDEVERAGEARPGAMNVPAAALEHERIVAGGAENMQGHGRAVREGSPQPPSAAKVAATEAAPGFPGTIKAKLNAGQGTQQHGKPSQRVIGAGQGRGRELQR